MPEPLKYYHIFNRANGWEKMFFTDKNYHFFIERYKYFITPIAQTLAYCLMPNHLHFLVKIKSENELKEFFGVGARARASYRKFADAEGLKTFGKIEGAELSEKDLQLLISRQFAKLFSSYTQSFNKVYKRKGSLFIPNFKRKEITTDDYLRQAILYIHNNPVKHGYRANPEEWIFSSYNEIITNSYSWISGKETIEIFDNIENFRFVHKERVDILNTNFTEE